MTIFRNFDYMQRLAFLLLSLSASFLWAQEPLSRLAGARSAALAHSTVALSDGGSAFHNQAASAFLNEDVLFLGYQNRYFLSDLQLGQGAYLLARDWGTVGFNVSYFGASLYNQSKVGLSYARAFGDFLALSLQLNYQSSFVSEASQLEAFTFETGVLLRPSDKLSLGFHVYNPDGQQWNGEGEQALPTYGRLGFLYEFDERSFLSGEIASDLNTPSRYAIGFEYRIWEQIAFRTGLGYAADGFASTGLGFHLNSLKFNLAYQYDFMLGNNAVIGLQWAF